MFDFRSAALAVLNTEIEALEQLEQYINDDFSNTCNLILANHDGKVVVMGMGKSGHIGKKIAATLASTGTSAFFVHPGEAAHGDLGMIKAGDILLAISNSGESSEILALFPVLKRLNIKVISMTGKPSSTMAKLSDYHLQVTVPKEACPLGSGSNRQYDSHSGYGRCVGGCFASSHGLHSGRLCFIAPEAL